MTKDLFWGEGGMSVAEKCESERAEVPTLHLLGRSKDNQRTAGPGQTHDGAHCVSQQILGTYIFNRVTSEHMRVPASSAAGEL